MRAIGWTCRIYREPIDHLPQHFLCFLPDPQGHGSFLVITHPPCAGGWIVIHD